jgi:predicted aminopeptidase
MVDKLLSFLILNSSVFMFKTRKRKILFFILFVLTLLFVVYFELIVYGIRQGYGQAKILLGAKPVETFIQDPNYPDSLKAKLLLIGEIRKFAIDSLGLNDTDVYKKMYDQQGKPVMWVVQAAEPYAMQSIKWKFPLIGAVPYKGFFREDLARKLENELKDKGKDVMVRNPGGWSTLGWFNDPILSNMLKRSDGDLAALIIHEMVHTTMFIKDSIDFNENLANFIGDWGASEFLKYKYGTSSKQYFEFTHDDEDYNLFAEHMVRGTAQLDSLYKTFSADLSDERRKQTKEEMIKQIIFNLDTLSLVTIKNPSERFKNYLPNNAYFMSFMHYEAKQNFFEAECEAKFKGDRKKYLAYLKNKYQP